MDQAMEKSALGIFVVNDFARTGDEHGTIGPVQNSPGQVPHNVVTEGAACLRSPGYDQVVFTLAHFGKNLIERESVTDPDRNIQAEFFQALLLAPQIASKLRIRSEQPIHIFL